MIGYIVYADARMRQAAAGRPVWQGQPADQAPRRNGRRADSQATETTPAAG